MSEDERRAETEQESDEADETETADGEPGEENEPRSGEEHGVDFHVVGVGASAGGLKALRELFQAMPEEPGVAFAVVQHMDPDQQSHLAEILGRATAMAVSQAEDGIAIEPNRVYTIPSDKFLEIVDGCLRLSEPFKEAGKRMPVDFLFRSLAKIQKHLAVGVVLSGSGSDGALGSREIRAAGGLVMAQEPQTAEYESMPRRAIETGAVDYTGPPAEIAAQLVSYVHQDYPEARRAVQTDGRAELIEKVLNLLAARTGRDFRCYKRSTVRRRVERRMGINQIDDLERYLDVLRDDEAERESLGREMLIGVTSFFREPDAFSALSEEALEKMVAEKGPDEAVRVWVPGCATGEEAYSLAILLQEMTSERKLNHAVQIFATDVDERALETARRGVYPDSIAADITEQRLERFFEKQNGSYQVTDRLRDKLVFAAHDLLKEPPFSNLDLVSCRNVLIYLEHEAQRRVLDLFAFALQPGGYLFVGKSDGVAGHDGLFDLVDGKHRIYRRNDSAAEVMDFPAGVLQSRSRKRLRQEAHQGRRDHPERLAELNQRVLLNHLDVAVVLASRSGDIVHFFGPTERYLQHPTGAATLNLTEMLEDELAHRVMPALRRVAQEKSPATLVESLGKRKHGERVKITATPLTGYGEEELYAVIFEPMAPRPEAAPPEEGERGTVAEEDLRAELRAVREDHRATVEELETSNEELRAANEEITSMNEELQATNEELQSSQEELQSVNEELQALNDQLNEKVERLREANADLTNLFQATGLPIVIVDTDLRIKRMSVLANRVFRVQDSDVGRPLSDINHSLQNVSAAEIARHVLDDLERVETEVQSQDGEWYLMRAVPYRTADDRIDGVVMTFSAITKIKAAGKQLRELNETLEERVTERTRLAQQRAERLRVVTARLTNAEERERQRLATMIHDDLQQTLAAAKMRLAAGPSEEPEKTGTNRQEAAKLIDDAIRTTRSLTAEFCPTVLFRQGLVSALGGLARQVEQKYGLRVSVNGAPQADLDPLHQTLVFRAVQELLSNVVKHADTDSAEISVEVCGDAVCVTVADEGTGFDGPYSEVAEAPGFGLFSIREQLAAIGGHLAVESTEGQGTKAVIEIPTDGSDAAPFILAGARSAAQADSAAEAFATVVVAEGRRLVRGSLVAALDMSEGICVVGQAEDGQSAVDAVEQLAPGFLVIASDLPGIGGVEATRRIRDMGLDTIVVGLADPEDEASAVHMLDAGAAACLDRNVSVEQFLRTLNDLAAGNGRSARSAGGTS